MSPEEFREMLQRKGAPPGCPVCGAEDWRGLDDVIDLPVRISGAAADGAHVRIPGFAALAPSCGHCGHVRLIDLQLLETPAPQGPGGDQAPRDEAEMPGAEQARPRGGSGQALTNLWGLPVSKRRGGRKP